MTTMAPWKMAVKMVCGAQQTYRCQHWHGADTTILLPARNSE